MATALEIYFPLPATIPFVCHWHSILTAKVHHHPERLSGEKGWLVSGLLGFKSNLGYPTHLKAPYEQG